MCLAVVLVACDGCDGGNLSKVCPPPEPCRISRIDGRVVSGDIKARGECTLGTTSCDENGERICVGYVHPVEEVCDGLDNDCDTVPDDGFDRDRDGFTTCNGDCNDDEPDQFPGQVEICNDIDDNCDGRIDEDLTKECWSGRADAVFGGSSRCVTGTSSCSAGVWRACRDQIDALPSETCNLIDDDCDGEVDETEESFCGPGTDIGACYKGDQVCSDGESFCVNAVFPSVEVCDNVDNDCDALIDEGLEQICQTACGVGVERCVSGEWINCDALAPQPELCDGVDNDCDGTVDEDCPCSQGDVGTCKNDIICGPVVTGPCAGVPPGTVVNCGIGISLCDVNGNWGACEYWADEIETCNDWDDDCDGTIDMMTTPCGDPTLAGVGVCRMGTSTCSAGLWSSCGNEVVPQPEICDGLDNDCDKEIDENLSPRNAADIWFELDGSGSMCIIVTPLVTALATYAADFAGTEHRFGLGVFPGRPVGGGQVTMDVLIPLTDFASFIAALSSYNCNYGGIEPGWDAAWKATESSNPLGINWKVQTGTVAGAFPYIIHVSDEHPNQGLRSEADVAVNTTNCVIAGCVPGDRVEFYVITPQTYWLEWDDPTFGEASRLIELFPAGAQRFVGILRGILANVCR